MKQIYLACLAFCIVPSLCFGHVGSPNVFFEGRAGDYSVYVVIRPPVALPGAAQVSVRVKEPGTRAVALLPVMWQAGRQGSPQAVSAQRVIGEANLWTAEVWLLRPGSYTVQVNVEGVQGPGQATVPVNVIAMQGRQMKPGLQATLAALGVLLFAGALFIISAVAREGCVKPHGEPTAGDRTRGRWSAVTAALLLSAGVAACAVRWRRMDLTYRTQGIQKPEPVLAAVRTEDNRIIVELRQAEQSVSLPSWAALVPDHGKLMHLFLLREPALDVFAHLHPVRLDSRTFALDVPPLPAGSYQLYGDVTFENGISQTLLARVILPEPVGGPLPLPPLATNLPGEAICGFVSVTVTNAGQITRDMDDSWHVGHAAPIDDGRLRAVKHLRGGLVARLMGGHTLFFENADAIMSGRETSLRFAAFTADGSEAALQPYMGMLGHAAVRRADGSVFAHLHPLGSFSMASREVFRQRDEDRVEARRSASPGVFAGESSSNKVSFPYQFPKPGLYRLWIQVRIAGRVLTGVYDVVSENGG